MNKIFTRILQIKYIEYYLLSIVLLVGFGVRLYKINNPIADWHSFRQADTAAVSRLYIKNGIDLLHPRYYDLSSTQSRMFNPEGYRFVEFPIYNALHALLAKNFTFFSLEVWGRLLTILFTEISAIIVFLLGNRFVGKWGGLISAFFFLFIPFNIYFTRVILPEPMAVCFALTAVYLFVRYIDLGKDRYLYFSAVLFFMATLIKPFLLFYTIPLIYLINKKYPLKKVLKEPKLLIKYLLFSAIILIPFFAWRAWMSNFPAGIPGWKWMLNGDGIRFRPAFWRWIFGERLGIMILGVWGLVLFYFGVLSQKKGQQFINFFLLGLFAYVCLFATVNVRHDYYQTIAIPAIALALAQGAMYLWAAKDFNKRLSRLLLIFSILFMLSSAAYQIKEFYKVNHPELVEVGKEVDMLLPKDAIIIAPYNGDTAFLYQTKRRGWPVIDTSVEQIIKRGASYYVSVSLNDTDTKMIEAKYETVEKTASYIIIDLTKPKK